MGTSVKLSIIAALERPRTLHELATQLGSPPPTIYTAVHRLERQGLLHTTKAKGRVYATASPDLSDRARAVLRDVPRNDWDQILRGDWPTMLHVLHQVGTARMTASVSGKSLSTVHHMIERLLLRGVLIAGSGRYSLDAGMPGAGVPLPDGGALRAGCYRINPRLSSLVGFLDAMMHIRALERVRRYSPGATLVWALGPEILFKAETPPSGTQVRTGALSAFADFGIEIVSPVAYWYASKRLPTAADFILQALLLRPTDPIRRSYAALLLESVLAKDGNEVVDELQDKAIIYGTHHDHGRIPAEVTGLVQYVKDQKGDERFLPWSEHQRYRQQYGLTDGGAR